MIPSKEFTKIKHIPNLDRNLNRILGNKPNIFCFLFFKYIFFFVFKKKKKKN